MARFAIFMAGCLALLGSAADGQVVDKAKKLTAAEIEKGVDELLAKYDTNKDGALTPNECPDVLKKAFEKFDRNGDGKLDRAELGPVVGFLRQMANPMLKGGTPEAVVDNLLKQFDADGDGKISRAEAKGRVLEAFDRLDANKDGFLDRAELRVLAQQMLAGAKGAKDGKGFLGGNANPDFDGLDKNADGRLTRDELKGTPWEARFAELDTDGNGYIDRREWDAFFRKK